MGLGPLPPIFKWAVISKRGTFFSGRRENPMLYWSSMLLQIFGNGDRVNHSGNCGFQKITHGTYRRTKTRTNRLPHRAGTARRLLRESRHWHTDAGRESRPVRHGSDFAI